MNPHTAYAIQDFKSTESLHAATSQLRVSVHQRHGVSRGGSAEGSGAFGRGAGLAGGLRCEGAGREAGPWSRPRCLGTYQLARSATQARLAIRERSFEPRAQVATMTACTPRPRALCAEIGAQLPRFGHEFRRSGKRSTAQGASATSSVPGRFAFRHRCQRPRSSTRGLRAVSF